MSHDSIVDELQLDGVEPEEVEKQVETAWAAFLATPEGQRYVGASPPVEARDTGDGDALATVLLIAIATGFVNKFGEKAAESLWEDIIRPAIRSKFGTSVKDSADGDQP